MKLAIMQPYFFPYIGYFQLINSVDEFVIYDNIEFSKKGWINRNRIIVNGVDAYISLPLKKDSDFLHINQRFLADTWNQDRKKMLNRIAESYRKAPYYMEVYPLIEKCIMQEDLNLFDFLLNSIQLTMAYLEINTKIIISSGISIDHQMKSEDKVIGICKGQKATKYINAIGGHDLYNRDFFKENGLELSFIRTLPLEYKQFTNEFAPWLSIIDVLMFNSIRETKLLLNKYELI
jgi:hypothetical protein